MTPVLSDQEIQAVADANAPMANLARAVEARVLEKLRKGGRLRGEWADGLSVSEAEARRREREAWDAAVYYIWPVGQFPQARQDWRKERDRLYPLPAPEPREVTGKSGTRYRRLGDVIAIGFGAGWTVVDSCPIPDAEAVASLLQQK